tara:strand:+ start:2686 stop:3309 length:624 start_codon:yes stop_codon:yes gene_type:complete
MSHTPKTPTPSYTTANLPTDLPEGSVVFDSSLQKLVSFKLGSWGTLGGVGSTTYVRDNIAGVIDQTQGDIPDNWKYLDSSLKGLVIGTSCEIIGANAFSFCVNLTGSLVIPNSVTSIRHDAFYQCSGFTGKLTIPNSVTSIGLFAFSECYTLTSIDCYVEESILNSGNILRNSGFTTIHVRSTDSTWTAGAGQTIGGKTGIEVIKDL